MPSPASEPELVLNFCKWSRLDISECVHHATFSQKRDAKLIRINGRRASWTLWEWRGMRSQCFSAPDYGTAKSQHIPWPTVGNRREAEAGFQGGQKAACAGSSPAAQSAKGSPIKPLPHSNCPSRCAIVPLDIRILLSHQQMSFPIF